MRSLITLILIGLLSATAACSRGSFEEQRTAAEARVGLGDPKGAVGAYRAMAHRFHGDERRGELLLRIADIQATVLNDPAAALTAYGEAIAQAPLSPAGQLARERRAALREERGDYEGAIEDYSMLLKYAVDDESRCRYRILLSGVYLAGGDFRQARVELKQMIEDPQSLPDAREKAYFLAAESFFLEGKTGRAIEYYQALLNAFPKSALAPEAKLHLATCLEEQGYLGPAREVTRGAAKDYPNPKVVDARLKSIDERGKMPSKPAAPKPAAPKPDAKPSSKPDAKAAPAPAR